MPLPLPLLLPLLLLPLLLLPLLVVSTEYLTMPCARARYSGLQFSLHAITGCSLRWGTWDTPTCS